MSATLHSPEFCGHGTCDLAARRAPETSFAATALLLMAPSMPFPEEFVQQAIRETVMHEVGHTLGLRHNFKASQMLTLEQMQDRDLVAKGGLLGSVKEYNSVNISRDPKRQGYWFSPTLGPYDYWAIEYGYRPLDPAREEEDLEKIAGRCNEANLAYATDEDTYGPSNLDPAATVFDMTSDPLAWWADRIALCEEMWGRDWKALEQPGYGYRLYRGAMASTLGAYRRALEIAARWVGGTHMDRRHPGDGGTPFRNVPFARQRQALSLVVDKGLAPDLFRFRPELRNLVAPSRFGHWGVDDEEEFASPLTETVDQGRLVLLLVLAALVGSAAMLRKRSGAVAFSVFLAGYGSLSVTLVILLAYQSAFGSVYERIGLLTAVFMAGTAAGARFGRDAERPLALLTGLEASAIVLFAGAPLFFRHEALFLLLNGLTGVLGGALFSAAIKFPGAGDAAGHAGRLYGLDLAGSFLGALLSAMITVPLIGLYPAVLLWAART